MLCPDKRPPADADAAGEASAGDRLSRRGRGFGAGSGGGTEEERLLAGAGRHGHWHWCCLTVWICVAGYGGLYPGPSGIKNGPVLG